jgi:tRNA pseudouridine55 synthase
MSFIMARKKKGDLVNGWVNFDKPLGMTSTEAVSKVRRAYNAQKAGHAGTLDPLASGILPIALGEATKTVPYLMDADKVYRFVIDWRTTTDTFDREGKVTAASDARPTEAAILQAIPKFIGLIEQVPPAFSAIKVDGKRSYDLARAGIEVELKAREVDIYDLKLTRIISNDEAEFSLHCGKGTYVRSLARDLCLELGVCGHVSVLRRARVGAFDEGRTIGLEILNDLVHREPRNAALLKVETALDDIPALPVTEDEAARLKQGREIPLLPARAQALKDALQTRSDAGMVSFPDTVQARLGEEIQALCELRGAQAFPVRIFNL